MKPTFIFFRNDFKNLGSVQNTITKNFSIQMNKHDVDGVFSFLYVWIIFRQFHL